MKEREQILELWRQSPSGVLVTVVKTLGSSYRRPGARLFIAENGRRAGSISGGCLEDDVVKKAWWLTEKGPAIRRYDTTPDGNIGPSGDDSGGFGLGCNGVIYLLLQRTTPLDRPSAALSILQRVHATRQPAVLAHILKPAHKIGTLSENEFDAGLQACASLRSNLTDATQTDANLITNLESGEEVFLETLLPPVRLLIFGAGDDAAPLSELATYMGWRVSVLDGRSHYARRDKFPSAQDVTVHPSEDSLQALEIDNRTVAVVMTHSYSQDLNFLKALSGEPLAYLGILGPRNRSLQLLAEAGIDAGVPSLHSPAGLDIGADGPEQVALSIVAEIQASLNKRGGAPLRDRSGSIHSRDSDGRSLQPFLPSIVCA